MAAKPEDAPHVTRRGWLKEQLVRKELLLDRRYAAAIPNLAILSSRQIELRTGED
jgi:hypothetical protein